MPVRVLSETSGVADVGDTWRCSLLVTDNDGYVAAPDAITGTVTLPAGTTAAATVTADNLTTGLYEVTYDLASAGRHLLAVTVTDATFGDDVVPFEVLAQTTGTIPDLEAVKAYLGDTSATDEEIADALAAETAAQRARCRIPVVYPADLAQALKRRVARNLAARAVPVATFTSFEGGGTSSRVPMLDAEITRFEAPYRRRKVG